MAENVVVFTGGFGGSNPNEPVDDVIEDLERLLDRARNGDLRGFAYATFDRQGCQGTGWAGDAGTRHPLGTAIMMLNHRYARGLLTGDGAE